MADTFTDQDLGIGTLLSDEDVGLDEEEILSRPAVPAWPMRFGQQGSSDTATLDPRQMAMASRQIPLPGYTTREADTFKTMAENRVISAPSEQALTAGRFQNERTLPPLPPETVLGIPQGETPGIPRPSVLGIPQGLEPIPYRELPQSTLERYNQLQRESLRKAAGNLTEDIYKTGRVASGVPPVEEEAPSDALQIIRGISTGAADVVAGFTEPQNLPLLLAGTLPGALGKAATALFMADMVRNVPEIYQQVSEALRSGDKEKEAEALVNALAQGTFFTLMGLHLKAKAPRESVQQFMDRYTPEQRAAFYERLKPEWSKQLREKALPEGETDASSQQKAAEIHGDVRSQSGQGLPKVPIEEGGEGVQPQAEKGVPKGQAVPELQLTPTIKAGDIEIKGESHADAITKATEGGNADEIMATINGERGFTDQNGKFYSRKEAAEIYKAQGGDPAKMIKPEEGLHSEDLKNLSKKEEAPPDTLPLSAYKGEVPEKAVPIKVRTADGKVYEAYRESEGDATIPPSIAKIKPSGEKGTPQRSHKPLGKGETIIEGPKTAEEYRQAVAAKQEAASVGPGAASPKDIGTASQITQLTQSIQNTASPNQPIGQRIQAAVKTAVGAVKAVPQTTGQAIKTGVQKLAAVTGAIKSGLTQLPVFTDFKRILGKWDGADQRAAHETRTFVQEINRRIPKDRQEAITNWIQAGGDPTVLQQRAAASTNAKLRKGYQDALTLNADEKLAAQNISNYLDSKLQEGLASGLLDHGLENYLNQVWKKPNPVTLKLQADLATGKLQPNFKFARQRVFDHYFEGEQAGYVPANKSVGALIGIYDQAFNRALSGRAFIKNLTEGKAGDGRPLVATSGSAGLVPKGQPPEALLVRPKTKPEDTADYKVIDHPALRKWMWQTQTPEGTPVMVQGDLLVHPEIYQHLKNVLGKSAWRQNKLGRAILGTEATIKQTIFSASGFHQVQETLHALGHRVNPTNLSDIDFNNPVHKEAVEHGLQLASYDAMEQFTDGLGSGPLINKIPIIGKRLLGPYTEWLFQDYIPRLKITMYEHALGRNAERYQDQIASGKMTEDQLLELTAKQANAAFGEQNYNWIGRNKTVQDSLRAFIVAPDFLEARAKFVGQAVRSHGREQLVALGLLAATQYITARILNKAIDDDYHFDKPFSLVAGKHEYELRTIPGDIAHLIKDPKKFATSRLAPIARQGVEFITGRDYRGVKRDTLDQIKDFAKLPTPISLRRQDDQRWWETFLNAFGVHERSATASQEMADKARQFQEKVKGKADVEILEGNESPYRKLRVSLDAGNEKASLQALQELRKTHSDSRILSTMQSHIRHPFTGSAALEHKFRQSLEPVELKKYQEAMVERKERYQKFKQLWAKRGQKPSAGAAVKEPQELTDEDVGL